MRKIFIPLLLLVPTLLWSYSFNTGVNTGGEQTFDTITASTGTISVLNISSATLSGPMFVTGTAGDIILNSDTGSAIRSSASGTASNLLLKDTDQRVYLHSREGSMRLTSGTSGNIGIEIDTSQNISVPLGTVTASTVTFTGLFTIQKHATPRTSVTPTAAGQMIYNSTGNQICISSGTTASTWVSIASTGTACVN